MLNHKKNSMLKAPETLLKLAIVLCACAAILMTSGGYFLLSWGQTPAPSLSTPSSVIHIAPGTTLKKLANTLFEHQLIDNPTYFRVYVRALDQYKKFQAGRYRFETAPSPTELITTFKSGDVYSQLMFSVNIPEGFSVAQIRARLIEKGIEAKALDSVLASSQLRQKFDISGNSLEGFIYPATYKFYDMTPEPETIITQAIQEFFTRLPKDYLSEIKKRDLTLLQAVTFASLIEKEASDEAERHYVSEVIWNRLKKRIPLAIDASVIYGIQDYNGDIRTKHLKDRNNPYNSRIFRGLPPGPIANPSTSSMSAVLEPSAHGYMYYVLVPEKGVARHHFSKTLKEHNAHVRKLVRSRRQ